MKRGWEREACARKIKEGLMEEEVRTMVWILYAKSILSVCGRYSRRKSKVALSSFVFCYLSRIE